jgi:hypothetical protein
VRVSTRHRENRSIERLPRLSVWRELALPFDPALRACLSQVGSQDESRCNAIQKTCTEPVRHN